MQQQSYSTEAFRPIAYVALDDPAVRARIVAILEDAGWTAIVEPTGFHLLHAIADIIEGSRSWLRPGLIVIDAYARGCAGVTIALGLRDLGITIPIVLVLAFGQPRPRATDDRMLHVVEPRSVEAVVTDLARSAVASIRGHVAHRRPRATRRAPPDRAASPKATNAERDSKLTANLRNDVGCEEVVAHMRDSISFGVHGPHSAHRWSVDVLEAHQQNGRSR